MNNKHLLELCDKLFKLKNEYGLYINSTTYIVRYIDDGKVCRCKYTKQQQ